MSEYLGYKGPVLYYQITVTDWEPPEKCKMQNKMFIWCESRLGGNYARRGSYKEHIKRMSNAYVQDK